MLELKAILWAQGFCQGQVVLIATDTLVLVQPQEHSGSSECDCQQAFLAQSGDH